MPAGPAVNLIGADAYGRLPERAAICAESWKCNSRRFRRFAFVTGMLRVVVEFLGPRQSINGLLSCFTQDTALRKTP